MPKRKKSSNKYVIQAKSKPSVSSALPFGVLAGVALIGVMVFLAYLPSIGGGFILDDDYLLTENKLIKASDGPYRFWCTTEEQDYWPVTYTTLWIEWRLWGMNSTGYHVTNMILHIVEALLVWLILRKLSIPGAFLAALIFAVHPVNVESVAWISQRKNTMAMLFFLLSILFYLKWEISSSITTNNFYRNTSSLIPHPSSLLWYWLSLAAFVLAMLSKGSVAILPVLLLGIVWWLRASGTVPIFADTAAKRWSAKMGLSPFLSRWDLLRTAPFFLVAVLLAIVNVWFQTKGTGMVFRTADFSQRLLGAGGVVWFYLYKAIFPLELIFIYPQWHVQTANLLWWLPLFAALVVTGLLWHYRNDWSRPVLFAWGFFCVALVPVMGFTDVGFMRYSLVADRYQHIAIIGMIALASAFWSLWHERTRGVPRRMATIIVVLAVGALAFLTWRQNGLYGDAIKLYQATLEKNPDCEMLHYNLGVSLAGVNKLQEAIDQYQQAVALNPGFADAYNNLGNTLFQAGRSQEAIKYYEHALRLKPDYVEAHYNFGIALVDVGRIQEAIEHYQRALELKPDHVDVHNNLGIALGKAGRLQEAIEHFQYAIQMKPNHLEAHYNLGNALKAVGQNQQAIEHYQQAQRLKPDSPDTHYNLGSLFRAAGQDQRAIEHFQQALRLKPDYPEVHYNLGNALVQTGRPKEAIKHYQQALRLKPNYVEAYYNLGNVLVQTGRLQEAVGNYREALRINPDFTEAHNNLGNALVQAGRPQEAIEHFQQALRLKPDFIMASYNLALAHALMHQSAEAIAAAQKALELAQSQGQSVQVKEIEDWLNIYRAKLSNRTDMPLPSKPKSTPTP